MSSTDRDSIAPMADAFASTRWSIVLRAGGGAASETGARDALSVLCEAYWYPLYAFVRRQGHSPHDAQDLTQAFFARLLARNFLGDADPGKGRFRSFLLGALKHFLSDEWDRARAQKRGGGVQPISLDAETEYAAHFFQRHWRQSAETRYQFEPAGESSAESIYDRRWALALLDQVLRRLRAEFARDDKEHIFDELKPALTGAKIPYAEIAARLDLKEGAVRTAVHRLRTRYRNRLRAEIAETVLCSARLVTQTLLSATACLRTGVSASRPSPFQKYPVTIRTRFPSRR